jgi:membrane protein
MDFIRKAVSLLIDAGKAWFADRASIYAAALAYYAIFALAPLTVVTVAIASLFVGRAAAAGELVDQIATVVGPEVAAFIQETVVRMVSPESSSWPAIISAIIALIGAVFFFNHLKVTLNAIWGVKTIQVRQVGDAFVLARSRADSLIMVFVTGLLLVGVVILGTIFDTFRLVLEEVAPRIAELISPVRNVLLPLVALTTFTLIFKTLPDARVRWRDALVGAALTTVLFTIGVFVIGRYLVQTGTGSIYGAASALVILLIWVYYSIQILLYGAEFTWLYAQRHGVPIGPSSASQLAGDAG